MKFEKVLPWIISHFVQIEENIDTKYQESNAPSKTQIYTNVSPYDSWCSCQKDRKGQK